jgi:hypothetical protein
VLPVIVGGNFKLNVSPLDGNRIGLDEVPLATWPDSLSQTKERLDIKRRFFRVVAKIIQLPDGAIALSLNGVDHLFRPHGQLGNLVVRWLGHVGWNVANHDVSSTTKNQGPPDNEQNR